MKTTGREMIKTLRRGLDLFGPQADKIIAYIASLQNADGGFRGRTTASDLYYTMFAEGILLAAQANFDRNGLIRYLHTIQPRSLDLIHLCCWIRCAADVDILNERHKGSLIESLNDFRCEDGLFHHVQRGRDSSVYGAFLALSAALDLDEVVAEPSEVVSRFVKFRNADGSYRNELQEGVGTIPATAAAIVVQSQLGYLTAPQTIEWILSCLMEEGGFAVGPMMPIADLLSTATALQALRQAGVDLATLRGKCVNFIRNLFQDAGGFCANAFDSTVDAEYTFYGLLALGNLNG